MTQSEENNAIQATTQLLDVTDGNLRSITRTLSADEQRTVSQIRSYMAQSRTALKGQDYELAHNLALKANQLSEGLLRQ